MRNLYHKIYNAVNEGIQKALLIDPEQNDVSINYSYHKIDNKLDILEYYASQILNSNDPVNYEKFKEASEISQQLGRRYKIKNLDEFNMICKKMPVFMYQQADDESRALLSWIDYDDYITVILKNGIETPLHKYNKNAAFLKIKANNDHDIILHKTLKISKNQKKWTKSFCFDPLFIEDDFISKHENAVKDFNGYDHTYNNSDIIKNNRIENGFIYPAFKYCQSLHINEYVGYLPAIGELDFLKKYQDIINVILAQYINDESNQNVLHLNYNIWWSSTEYEKRIAWYLDSGCCLANLGKNNDGYVLPFFAKNVNN